MKSIKNRVQLLGHIAKIISIQEHKYFKKMARFSVITNERYKDKNGEFKSETSTHLLVVRSGIAENIEKWVKVGSSILVEGKLAYYKKDDSNIFIAQIEVHEMIVLSNKD